MGIKGLRSYLRTQSKKTGVIYEYVENISKYVGLRISIDASLYIHKIYHGRKVAIGSSMNLDSNGYDDTKFDERMFSLVASSIASLLQLFATYNIEPVFVFEQLDEIGAERKSNESSSRNIKYINSRNTYNEIMVDYNQYLQAPPMNQDNDIVYNNLSQSSNDLAFRKELTKSYLSSKKPSNSFIMQVMTLLSELNIPTVLGNCEGEKLCVSLWREGIVNAVYSADTDCYAMGCEYIINDINTSSETFTIVYHSKILEMLRMNLIQFRDLCILSGTDFNSRISQLGPARIHNMIMSVNNYNHISQLYGKFRPNSSIILYEADFECIKYYECIELFSNFLNKEQYIIENNTYYEILLVGDPNEISLMEYNRKYLDYHGIVNNFIHGMTNTMVQNTTEIYYSTMTNYDV